MKKNPTLTRLKGFSLQKFKKKLPFKMLKVHYPPPKKTQTG